MTQLMMDVMQGLIVPGLLGFGGAWLAGVRLLAAMEQRVRAVEARVDGLEADAKEAARSHLDVVERLARLEAKIDVALATLKRSE